VVVSSLTVEFHWDNFEDPHLVAFLWELEKQVLTEPIWYAILITIWIWTLLGKLASKTIWALTWVFQ
jgi:hypothetical protein